MPLQQDAHVLRHLAYRATVIQFVSRDPARNRSRWYVLHRATTLDGQPSIMCLWGRIGQPLHCRAVVCANAHHAEELVVTLIRWRRRHGYQIVTWE